MTYVAHMVFVFHNAAPENGIINRHITPAESKGGRGDEHQERSPMVFRMIEQDRVRDRAPCLAHRKCFGSVPAPHLPSPCGLGQLLPPGRVPRMTHLYTQHGNDLPSQAYVLPAEKHFSETSHVLSADSSTTLQPTVGLKHSASSPSLLSERLGKGRAASN